MKKVIYLLLLSVTATLFGYDETRKASLNAAGVSKIHIKVGAGSLEILQGGEEITVEAEIVIADASAEGESFVRDNLELSLDKNGDVATLIAGFKEGSGWFQWKSMQVNLVVRVPAGRQLRVEDGSGSIRISGLKNDLRLNDGSGDLEINDVKGDVEVEDGSGSIEVNKIAGNVRIEDGSGEILVRDVDGSVEVSDGSGSIRLSDIRQDVIIHDDGSGRVSISNVDGKIIRHDHDND